MEVYVLELNIDYEPGYILGVFSSPEKAKKTLPNLSWKESSGTYKAKHLAVSDAYYIISEKTIDENAGKEYVL